MVRNTALLSTFIIGFCDGLVLPVVVITILSQLTNDSYFLLQISALFIVVFSIVMGISHYYTAKNHAETTIKTDTFQNIGLSKELETQLLKDHELEKQEWEAVLQENEITKKGNYWAFLITSLSYILSGSILLLPFYFFEIPEALIYTYVITLLLTFIFGLIKAKLTDNHPMRAIGKGLLNKIVLCGFVYLVSYIFK